MTSEYSIAYVKWSDLYERERPFMLFVDIPQGHTDQRRTNVEFESHKTKIHDIRNEDQKFGIETHGFTFREIPRAASQNDPKAFDDTYTPLVKEVLKQEFPDADEILITGWRWRNSEEKRNKPISDASDPKSIDLNNPSEYLMPAENAHTDTCPMGAMERVAQACEKNGINRQISRARIVNVWRPVLNTVYDWPLAICDARTVAKPDLVQVQQVYPDSVSTPMFVRHSPAQRWYYARHQTPAEAWIFKQFDSAEEAGARFCPHVAFFDPSSAPDAPYRKSVEVRAVVINYEG